MLAAAEELAGRIGQTTEACEALGVARSTLYRRRQPSVSKPKRVLSKNTNELKTGAPGRFDRHRPVASHRSGGVSEAMSAIRVLRTRRENTVQQRDATLPGRKTWIQVLGKDGH